MSPAMSWSMNPEPDFAEGAAAPAQQDDQATGLRRLFRRRACVLVPVVANPHGGAASPKVLETLARHLAALGRRVLVVDGAATSPAPLELAAVDLAACLQPVGARIAYLAARGLVLEHVDARGSAAGFLQALRQAAPQAEVIVIHADGVDMARLLKGQAVHPILLGADHEESLKHAYANAKLLQRRCQLAAFDFLLVAPRRSSRAARIVRSLRTCLESFIDAGLRHTAQLDTAEPAPVRGQELGRLLAAQLRQNDLTNRIATSDSTLPDRPQAAARFEPNSPAFR